MSSIEWPQGLTPTRMEWGRAFNSHDFTSPFSQSQQVVIYPGAYWRCELSFRNLSRDRERVLSTFIGRLQGRANTFRLYPWTRRPGPARGSAVVDGTGAASGTLASRNWTASTLVLRMGDYITVGDQLLEVLEDIESNGEGRAIIPVSPWLRVPPSNGETIHYQAPYAIMRLESDEEMRSVESLVAGATLRAREAF